MAYRILSAFIILLFFSTAFSAEENFRIVDQKELPNQLGTFRTIEFNTSDHEAATLYAVTFNRDYHANFHLQENVIQFFANYLDAFTHNHDFIVGINGGFYYPDFTPAGLLIYHGKTVKPLVRSSIFKACVLIDSTQKIRLETDLDQCKKATNAMQTGPLLIENGKVNTDLLRIQQKSKSLAAFFNPHKRTLLALTGQNRLVMITTSPLALFDVARFLQDHPDAVGATHIQMAVNLDGGSSTGMYIRFPDQPFYFHELKHVKTFIFIN
ncbi:MAG TPA: phosphodiester glycosidase family protein [Gammaproteobacteria bacterium]|nr:phosphodiester glycosidase family protein [Gammaproteobacteria bacterium]